MKSILTISALAIGLALSAGTASATTDDWKTEIFKPSPGVQDVFKPSPGGR